MTTLRWVTAACGMLMCSLGLNLVFSSLAVMSPMQVVNYVLLTPFLEELAFRWAILRLGGRVLKNVRAAVWFQAILFAAWHWSAPAVIPYALFSGWIFAILYIKSGKLDAAYLAHMAANTGAVIRSFLSATRCASTALAGAAALMVAMWLLYASLRGAWKLQDRVIVSRL